MSAKPTKQSPKKDQTAELDRYITDRNQKANELRSEMAEFHGLEREFAYTQGEMLLEYRKAKDLKNPRERGDARENILRRFLIGSGLLPDGYRVTKVRARVVSPTGHASDELDVVLFDRRETVVLMRRSGVAEVYPRECVFGTIQVKSKLTKRDIIEGFKNLASYKALYNSSGRFFGPFVGRPLSNKGFGLLFSFDTDLEWDEIVKTVQVCANGYHVAHLPNAIFILSKGTILFSQDLEPRWHNDDMAKMTAPTPFSLPNQGSNCLWRFYELSMDLLRSTATSRPNIGEYFRLPLTTGTLSYHFALGVFSETGHCPSHGDFLRKITAENLTKIIEFCRNTEPINWVKALELARGLSGDNEAAYSRQPGEVKIYNPDNKPLKELLQLPEDRITYDDLVIDGVSVWVPYFYSQRDGLIGSCPKCAQRRTRRRGQTNASKT
jgi:hypothetical protein